MSSNQHTHAVAPHIALIGCGKMGGAMLRGWLAGEMNWHFSVIDPAAPADNDPLAAPNVDLYPDIATFAVRTTGRPDIYILAVKPQIMDKVCEDLAAYLSANTKNNSPILSIAAGYTLEKLASHFGDRCPCIRAMPNTPASIGAGVIVACANPAVTREQRDLADLLLKSAGQTFWIEDEGCMDAVTAISGSGPAYVFYLIEAMAKAGTQRGLDENLAAELARGTVIGAARLAAHDQDASAEELRLNVTSPGGTTEAAMEILLDDNALLDLIRDAVAAATHRSRELGS